VTSESPEKYPSLTPNETFKSLRKVKNMDVYIHLVLRDPPSEGTWNWKPSKMNKELLRN